MNRLTVRLYDNVVSLKNVDEFNLAKYIYDKGDISQSSNIFQKFEINFAEAKKAIEDSDEANYFNNWTLKAGEAVFIGPLPKIQAIRGFLYNHIYHHRGELIAHLRATGNKVPSLYGPNFEESKCL